MKLHLQLELPHDLRCRLPVPFVYVPKFYISWHWDPDALACWYSLMHHMSSRLESWTLLSRDYYGVQDWRWKL